MNRVRIIGKAILEHYANGFFSLDQIVKLTKLPRAYSSDVLLVFSQEGLIKKIKKQRKEHTPGRSPCFSVTYRLINKKGLAARLAPKQFKDTLQDRMWKVIRYRRVFTRRDLVVLTSNSDGKPIVSNESARWFLKALRRGGFIQASRTGGGPGVEWTLIKDVGPKRPYVTANVGAYRHTPVQQKGANDGEK